ncbi:MAG: response regulator transcription factor [Dethiobacter sp.]|nr:response regulator transcription factor [Dethiobacter sp.]
MRVRILVADGDNQARSKLKELLSAEGFAVDLVADGITAIKYFRRYEYHLAILEMQLPELDGKNVSRQFSKIADIPFVFLSSDPDEETALHAYSLGAEDYITKPFSGKLLVARLKVILRRRMGQEKLTVRSLNFEGLYIDTLSRTVYVDERQAILTPKEYQLLLLLAKNPNQAFSREMILNELWGQDYFGTDRTVDTHVKTLREAIKPHHHYISTVRGFGYIFNEFKERVN